MIMRFFLDVSTSVSQLIIELAWISSALLGAVILAVSVLRRQSASLKQLVLSTGIVVMLVAAVAVSLLPRWTVTTPDWFPISAYDKSVVAGLPNQNSSASETGFSIISSTELMVQNSQTEYGYGYFVWAVSLIWLVGILVVLLRLWTRLRGLRYLRCNSRVLLDEESLRQVGDATRRLGLKRRVTVVCNTATSVPITWGIVRPVILLPGGFQQLPANSRRAVLHHELSHVQRQDFLLRVLAEILCAVLWFQPLVWIVRQRLRKEQENACDDRVLALGEKASSYARLLLEWQEKMQQNGFQVALGMAHRNGLKLRLQTILDQNVNRSPLVLTKVLAVCLLTLGLALPLVAFRLSKATPSESRRFLTSNISGAAVSEGLSESKAGNARNRTPPKESTQSSSEGRSDQLQKVHAATRESNKPSRSQLPVSAANQEPLNIYPGTQDESVVGSAQAEDASSGDGRQPTNKRTISPQKIPATIIRNQLGDRLIVPDVTISNGRNVSRITNANGERRIAP